MNLAAGTRLGPYEIAALIGSGGMGEIYRARDTRLDRTVAIKVLPAALAEDPQFRERFDREARAISQLDHPHICALYDVGEAVPSSGPSPVAKDGVPGATDSVPISFLVMQHLEGETLAERLSRPRERSEASASSTLPVGEALTIAIQIAGALDAAHRRGITHRDLKPGNIMLTKTGAKVLDFGLAKHAAVVSRGPGPGGRAPGVSALPTQGAPLTRQGALLGTLQYMAPEQLEGREADPRTDLFALGTIVHEMLTGRRAFEGHTQASVIAAIIGREPVAVTSLQPLAPAALDRVIRKCLAKDPDDRWQSARDLVDELKWIEESRAHPSASSADETTRDVPVPSRAPVRGGRERVAWIAALAVVTIVAVIATVLALRPTPQPPEMRLEIVTPATADPASLAISPDGRQLVFVASDGGRPRLWLRDLNLASARPLAGTDDATYPFWSPDGASVGFFGGGKLKRIDVASGSLQLLASAPVPRGGAWGPDGTILFAPTSTGALLRVPATGGAPMPATRLEPGVPNHRFPQFLPDRRGFLYYVLGSPEVRGVYMAELDGSPSRRLFDADAAAHYLSSGHLLFVRQATLFAQRFDDASGVLIGTPVALAEHVAIDPVSISLAAVSVSSAGPIVYRSASAAGSRQFVWFDRSGREIGRVGDPLEGAGGSLSPDGRRVALLRTLNGNSDIWVLELERGVFNRFTSDGSIDNNPVFAPDGRSIAFSSNRKGFFALYQTTGPGADTLILSTGEGLNPVDWSRDGRFLLFRSLIPATGYDLWALPMQGDRKPFPVVQTEFDEHGGAFSPDGRWLAYQSNATGRFEVYVQPFPGPGARVQVSSEGGGQARWHPDGRELFYIGYDDRLTAVPLTLDAASKESRPGAPVPLFVTRIGGGVLGNLSHQYAVSPDGRRFLMNTLIEDATAPIGVILNWKGK